MKVILLTLSGDLALARERLQARFPEAVIESIAREQIAKRGAARSAQMLRAMQPDVFAIAAERLVWQRGQNAFFILGGLAGARRTIILDAHDGWREMSRTQALLKAPAQFARETAISAAAMKRAGRDLRRLEAAIEAGEHRRIVPDETPPRPNPSITYLRASPGPGTQAGGAASHINGFLDAALQLGAHVWLVSNDEIAGVDQSKLPVKIIWPKPVGSTRPAFDIHNNLVFTEGAIEEVARHQPDFVYQRYARFSWAGVAAGLQNRRPLFLEYNGSEVWVGRYWDHVGKLDLLARYERLNLRAASRIFVVSEVERQNLLRVGVDAGKIIVNPNAVDVDLFKPGIGGAEVRRDFGLKADEILVGFVGTFGPWHGVEVLAKSIALTPTDRKIRFLLVGSGALRGRVEDILREANAADRVIFAGSVAHERVPKLLDACDVLASPHVPLEGGAEFFGSPTKLFEYMAMGKAIVASRLGQIGEVLADGETALLIEPGNVPQLAHAIVRLSNSPELRQRLGAAARKAAVERHTWKQNAQRVLDEYRRLFV
jgi:glycosyltransferase involved in cell wall biosynthesis